MATKKTDNAPKRKRGRPRKEKAEKARIVAFARRRGAKAAAAQFGVSEKTVARHIRDLRGDPDGVRAVLEAPEAAEALHVARVDDDEPMADLIELPGTDLEAARQARRLILRSITTRCQLATALDLRWLVQAYQVINDAVTTEEFLHAGGSEADRRGPAQAAG